MQSSDYLIIIDAVQPILKMVLVKKGLNFSFYSIAYIQF